MKVSAGQSMCRMTSAMENGETRVAALRQLLKDASPKNPTYILGRIIADFKSQSTSELTVRQGEEVFVLFEIDDWAFATLLTDSSKKGYVPLDYCQVIRNFYESPNEAPYTDISSRCSKTTKNSDNMRASSLMQRDNPESDTTPGFGYYETRVKRRPSRKMSLPANHRLRSPAKTDSQRVNFHKIEHGVDNFTNSFYPDKCSRIDTSISCSTDGGCRELYAEQTSSSKRNSRVPECCCCCANRRCKSRREERYDNVLHYLRDSHVDNSHCDESESGLGDSESILSLSEAQMSKDHVDLSDMATQTSQSLENLQKQLELMSADLEQAATAMDSNRMRKEKACSSDNSSPQPSDDSVLSKPQADAVNKRSSTSLSDTNKESDSPFDREDCNTVKRKGSASLRTEKTVGQNCSNLSNRKLPDSCKLSQSNFSVQKRLSLPALEKGNIPNRTELCQLSATIINKLKPARDELLSKRPSSQGSTAPHLDSADSSTEHVTRKPSELTLTPSTAVTEATESPATPNSVEIKQRKMTLQSIQEQYMKLEEARLLHNALKHLNDTMHATELHGAKASQSHPS
ncbi:uncharacterized protein [Watersipora subatra]|uniref:uncharacterized protein n=1 Tax=Watersipora subatra TaxID=2589382 RepID=UPI00355AD37A